MSVNLALGKLSKENKALQKSVETEKNENQNLTKICNFLKIERHSFVKTEQKRSEKEAEMKDIMKGHQVIIKNLEIAVEGTKKENTKLTNVNMEKHEKHEAADAGQNEDRTR